MNLNDRFLRGLLVGALAGGLSGYLLSRHVHQARADAEVSEAREYFRSKVEDLERQRDDATVLARNTLNAQRADYGLRPVGGFTDEPAREALREERLGTASDYLPRDQANDRALDPDFGLSDDDYEDGAPRSLGVDGNGDGIEEDGPEDEGGHQDGSADSDEEDSDPPGTEPYEITIGEFSEGREHYQKLTVTYYRGDQVLCDDDDAPIRDINGTVGQAALNRFGADPENPKILYYRNPRIQVDFEICLDLGSYVEAVLGYGTANPKPPRNSRE